MSVVNINQGLYEFEAFITNANNKGSVFPVEKGAISNFIIEDTLAFPGLRGSISFSNFYGLAQKLDTFDFTNDLNTLSVKIVNKDGDDTQFPIQLAFDAILNEGVETANNVIDRQITFTFEELNIGLLKYKYITCEDLLEATSATAAEYILRLLYFGLSNRKQKEDMNKLVVKFEDTGIPAPVGSLLAPSNEQIANTPSCYEVLRRLMRGAYYNEGEPALLQIKNVYDSKTKKPSRKYTLVNQARFIRDFFTTIRSAGNTEPDLSKYVLETFIMGSSSETRSLGSNFVDKYQILRPNLTELLSKKWVDYSIVSNSSNTENISETEVVQYVELKDIFETAVLGGVYRSNLPNRGRRADGGDLSLRDEYTPTKTYEPEIKEWPYAVVGMVLKSFMYDNIALTFRVPGALYREPGFFIRVKLDSNEEVKKDTTQDLNGYYYVISVRHIFEESIYTNEFVAVKFYTLGTASGSANNSLSDTFTGNVTSLFKFFSGDSN